MLTVAKLAVLIKYSWDFPRFEAGATTVEKALMDVDWYDLSELLNDLKLYHQNLVSPAYARKILTTLRQICADEETAQTLIGYASTL